MLKSISLLSVLGVASLLIAGLPGEDPAQTCPGGACASGSCSKATAKACAGCPAATAVSEGESPTCTKDCQNCPAGEKCAGSACTKNCGNCPAAAGAKQTSATPCAGGACATTACGGACGKDCQDCPITAAMKALPQMTYTVGEEKTCCPKAAAELAQKSNAPIHYVVAEKSFDSESDAKLALVEATEQFVATFAEPKVCTESGKVAIAGKQLCCENAAAQTAAVVKAAMDKVEMTYLVGEKECHCPVEAAKLAKDSGDPTVYLVSGESTGCNVTARLNLARAKYKAAVVAVMQTETQTTEKLTSRDS